MSTIIGLVGPIGAGKETFIKRFTELVAGLKVQHFRTSGLLKATLDAWSIPATRENLQNLAIIMEGHYGTGTLSHALQTMMAKSDADYILYDCIRWHADVELIKSFPSNIIVYITADPKIRWKRKHENSEKIGERGLSYEEFCEAEKRGTETQIQEIGGKADIVLVKNGEGLEKFNTDVEFFLTYYIKPRFERGRLMGKPNP